MSLKARGMSLVEALVALLVLSIGMLGIAGLFVESVRSSRTALLRTQAINLVSDMADRIRANATAGVAYDIDTYGGAPAIRNCAPDPTDVGGNCTVVNLAEDDLARWITQVNLMLPAFNGNAPQAAVQRTAPVNAGGPERYQITVSWQEPGEAAPFTYATDVVIIPRLPQA